MSKWPLQKDCIDFYGNPNSVFFEADHITRISFPWNCTYNGQPVKKAAVNVKCADAFSEWFDIVWTNAEKRQTTIDAWGMSKYGGGFAIRNKRSGNSLSMHAFGCALDFDPVQNPFHVENFRFKNVVIQEYVVEPFLKLGGVWGGSWHPPDAMHFQFARVK